MWVSDLVILKTARDLTYVVASCSCWCRPTELDAAERERQHRLVAHGLVMAEQPEQREELRERREQHRQGRPALQADVGSDCLAVEVRDRVVGNSC